MARIQKREMVSGTTYVVKWRAPDGTDRSKGGFTTKRKAEAYATKLANGKLVGIEYDPKSGEIPFRDAATLWLDSRHDLKTRTLAGYREMLAPAADRRGQMAKLGIDAVFGGYPVNAITREHVSAWVERLTKAGKKPSTVRHHFYVVKQVLAQAVADRRIPFNPADNVKLPTEHSSRGNDPAGVVDDPAKFLTPTQVAALVAAMPWPFNVYVHLAVWSGLRAGELCGLVIADLEIPAKGFNPNKPAKPGKLRVERTVIRDGNALAYNTPKTRGSRRTVPLTAEATELLRDYLADHPRADEPNAPLFPGMRLTAIKPTGVAAEPVSPELPTDGSQPAIARDMPKGWRTVADRQAKTLGALTVAEAQSRLVLDWSQPLRHLTFYKAVFRPAILRANRMFPNANLDAGLVFHSLRHTYVSLCVAAGIKPLDISRFAGHSKVTTTLNIYAHLFEDDHTDAMAALGAMATPTALAGDSAPNVIPLRG
ncbi:integrase [Mycolicibacterium fortuitum]|uniref:tyrosine-type recombinase/integrase n=1 Tax=Mycolicibacterium fortuitum TaxID=1766 RepID=UPI0007EDB5B5|nr:tyrosine-type recombinase/integrase [Mycolicibacterium fortuitum]OBI76409.1 integrase [Mycolicibacterium fortuitum]